MQPIADPIMGAGRRWTGPKNCTKGKTMSFDIVLPVVSHPLRLADLPQRKSTHITLQVSAEQMDALAKALDISSVRKLTFKAELKPTRGADWMLSAQLGATVVQPCRVTLDPVTTRIDEVVTRQYIAKWEEVAESEAEMPEDDTAEPLPELVDIGAVMEEALALALPAFPRADSADTLNLVAAPEGVDPLTDDAVKPFAGLAALKAQMEQGED